MLDFGNKYLIYQQLVDWLEIGSCSQISNITYQFASEHFSQQILCFLMIFFTMIKTIYILLQSLKDFFLLVLLLILIDKFLDLLNNILYQNMNSYQKKITSFFSEESKNLSSQQLQDLNSEKSTQPEYSTKRNLEGLFIGPSGANFLFLGAQIQKSLKSHQAYRNISRPSKSQVQQIRLDKGYQQSLSKTEEAHQKLLKKLQGEKVPFHSHITCGHMKWDISIPSILGYTSVLFSNPNNVAYDASQVTTILQIECVNKYVKMIDYPQMIDDIHQNLFVCNKSWGHFTSGGSVANSEAIWGARNMKYLAISLKLFVESLSAAQLKAKAQSISVKIVTGEKKCLQDLSVWQLLNITNQDTMSLYNDIFEVLYSKQIQKYSQYAKKVQQFTLSMCGYEQFQEMLQEEIKKENNPNWPDNKLPRMRSFISSSGHYSFAKAASLLGLGQKYFNKIEVDLNGRIDIIELEAQLNECAQKHIPVLVVVGILGSSESSAVDNIGQIVRIKQQMAKKGLNFHFHIDGAYGGYFLSMIRDSTQQKCSLSEYTENQLSYAHHCDSITIDPHKTGYVPYQCGLIAYKDHRFRLNLNFSAPYMLKEGDISTSIYGIEGSKAGATVGSVYMSLQTMPLNRNGHGQLLEMTLVNTKILTAALQSMKNNIYYFIENDNIVQSKFSCLLLTQCSTISKISEVEAQMFNQQICNQTPQSVNAKIQNTEQTQFSTYYRNMGPDLNILCYAINFVDPVTNKWNRSLRMVNKLNQIIIEKTRPSSKPNESNPEQQPSLFLSSTTKSKGYSKLIRDFIERHDLVQDDDCIHLIRSTVMNPFFINQNKLNNSSYPESSNKKQLRFTKELSHIAFQSLKQMETQL